MLARAIELLRECLTALNRVDRTLYRPDVDTYDLASAVERFLKNVDGDEHNCEDNAVRVETGGPLGHGWECGRCGKFLQAG